MTARSGDGLCPDHFERSQLDGRATRVRLWRDLGYAVGTLLAGIVADAFGLRAAMWTVAALTGSSGLVSAFRMTETLRRHTKGEDNVT